MEPAVAFGLLTILAVLVVLGTRRPRDEAARKACVTNLLYLGRAHTLYVEDYDGCAMAPWYGTAPTPQTAYTWRFALAPYLKSPDMFYCPREPAPRGQRWSGVEGPFTRREFLGRSSYAANTVHAAPGGPTPPFDGQPRLLARTAMPAYTFAIVEAELPEPWLDHYRNDHGYDGAARPGTRRHGTGRPFPDHVHLSAAYLDGRVGCGPTDRCPGELGGADQCPWSLE